MHLSIISPVYKAEALVEELVRRITETAAKITDEYEIILVDDRSPDNSWEKIEAVCQKDPHVKGVLLSRNYGQQYAITAGLAASKGDFVAILDCDLQNPPEEIAKLYSKIIEGYDCVFGQRVLRRDSFMVRYLAKIFYRILSWFTNSDYDSSIASFSISSRKLVDSFLLFNEQDRLFQLIVGRLGYRIAKIEVAHAEREDGVSSYTIRKKIRMALGVILAQSNKPLILSAYFGVMISFISFIAGIIIIIQRLFFSVPVAGWASTMVVLFFVSGLIFANLGILGIYLGKIFDYAKNRPLYLVDKKVNFTEK